MIGIPSQQYRKKPTMQQTELADLHFVDAKRIKELGNAAELPAYRTMVRCLDETSVEKNREQLEALLRAFGKERQHFIDLLFTRDHRAFCIGNRWRKLRDTLVMEKYRSSYGLQARHWKMALQTAAATVSNYWRLVQANALSRIRRKDWFARLNKLEQRYVYFLLGSLSEDFFTMLDGKCPSVVTDTEKESIASRKGLCKAMVRTIHDEQGKRPKHGRDASVWFDCSCYKAVVVGEQVRLDLMSLTPGVRLTLYVKGCVPVRLIHRKLPVESFIAVRLILVLRKWQRTMRDIVSVHVWVKSSRAMPNISMPSSRREISLWLGHRKRVRPSDAACCAAIWAQRSSQRNCSASERKSKTPSTRR